MYMYSKDCCSVGGVKVQTCLCIMSSFQLGTLGAGNHYAEIQVVDEIYDGLAATRMGIEEKGQVSDYS